MPERRAGDDGSGLLASVRAASDVRPTNPVPPSCADPSGDPAAVRWRPGGEERRARCDHDPDPRPAEVTAAVVCPCRQLRLFGVAPTASERRTDSNRRVGSVGGGGPSAPRRDGRGMVQQ